MKGFILNTIEEYEAKQSELAISENVDFNLDEEGNQLDRKRYAGRLEKGVTIPDITLKDGTFFIPFDGGIDTIELTDLNNEE